MSRNKILYGVVIGITLVCLCLMLKPFFAYGENLSGPPKMKKAFTRLEGVVAEVLERFETKGIDLARQFASQRGVLLKKDNIRVVLEMKSNELATKLQLPVASIEKRYGNLVQVSLPLGRLNDLIAMPGINFVREPLKPLPLDVVSEGVGLAGANDWHNAGFEGEGVKVAVLDCTGFAGYQGLLGTELPPAERVVVRSFRADGLIDTGNHGTACAEVVYDMAPGATLYLVNYNTEVELGNAVDWLIAENVHIGTHSVGWLNAGPVDGTGTICNMVNDAHDAGILWVNSIGNQAQRHWSGYFIDSDGDDLHEFAEAGPDETMALYAYGGQTIVATVSWNDWGVYDTGNRSWSGSNQNYDLHLYIQFGRGLRRVASSTTIQNGNNPPVEGIIYNVHWSGNYHLVIENSGATGEHYMEVYSWNHDLQYQVPEGSLTIPSDAAGSFSVGAAYWQDQSREFFSSWGPPNDFGGNPPLPCSIVNDNIKPEILGPDGVSSVTTGAGAFYGSSSSSPHVAGAAALLLSSPQYSNLSPEEIQTVLEDHAVNNGYGTLPDCKHGYGLLTMPPLSVNNPPVAADDSAVTDEDHPVSINVLANDTDEENDPLSVTDLTQPVNGTADLNGDNTVTYTPNADFNGSDAFTYKAFDGIGTSNSATVNVTVNPVNDAPAANNDIASTSEGTAVTINVLSNDTDADNDSLSVTNLTQPFNGSAALNVDNTVTYTPNSGFMGVDTFTYIAFDGTANSNTATVSVTVSAGNQPPTADAGPDQTADEGANVNFDGSGSSDSDGTIISYEWEFGDSGSASGVTASHVYADNGTYTVTLMVTDNNGATDTDTTTVTIGNVAPIADAGGPYNCNIGEAIMFTGSATDPGTDDVLTYSWDFGDGDIATGQVVSHTYEDIGDYAVTLRVEDDDGGIGIDTTDATVNPSAHIAYTTIDMSKRAFWKWWRATADITVRDTDASSLPIDGATVIGHWSGVYGGPVSGITESDGTVSFRTGWITDTGTVTFTIEEVSKEGNVYSLNGEVIDSISN